jgi:predicted amino acid racemase
MEAPRLKTKGCHITLTMLIRIPAMNVLAAKTEMFLLGGKGPVGLADR